MASDCSDNGFETVSDGHSALARLLGNGRDDVFSELPSPSLAGNLADANAGRSETGLGGTPNANFDHAIGSAWNSLTAESVEPIWETGFWKCIFGNDSLGDALSQQFKRPAPVEILDDVELGEPEKRARAMSSQVALSPLFQTCVKSTDDVSWQEKRGTATKGFEALACHHSGLGGRH